MPDDGRSDPDAMHPRWSCPDSMPGSPRLCRAADPDRPRDSSPVSRPRPSRNCSTTARSQPAIEASAEPQLRLDPAGDANRTLTSCGHDIFGWSMRPWESVPATPRGRAADSQGRMDHPITDRLRVIGCEKVYQTAVDLILASACKAGAGIRASTPRQALLRMDVRFPGRATGWPGDDRSSIHSIAAPTESLRSMPSGPEGVELWFPGGYRMDAA